MKDLGGVVTSLVFTHPKGGTPDLGIGRNVNCVCMGEVGSCPATVRRAAMRMGISNTQLTQRTIGHDMNDESTQRDRKASWVGEKS